MVGPPIATREELGLQSPRAPGGEGVKVPHQTPQDESLLRISASRPKATAYAACMSHRSWTMSRESLSRRQVVAEVRVRLTGSDAELGRIAASDVARLLQGVERALGRAAAGIAGRRAGLTGRRGRVVERATRLIFDRIESGSVLAVLEVPGATDEADLGLQDLGLGEAALIETLDVLEHDLENHDVAAALALLAEDLDIGGRFDAIGFEVGGGGAVSPRSVSLDRTRRLRMRQLADATETQRPDELYGVLYEANFERRTAQLRLPTGGSVTVTFSDYLADRVHEALRERSHLEGVVSYNRESAQATSVELRSVHRVEQEELGLEGGEFWHERNVRELAREQGIETLTDPRELRDDEATEDEVAALLAALGR